MEGKILNKQTEAFPEETLDPDEWESMRTLSHRILDDAMDYLETLRDRPVWQHAPDHVKPHFESPPPLGCVLVRNADDHRREFSLTPSYLAHGEGERGLTGVDVPWLADYGFELSRGFHALKAWMTIKEHGTAKYGQLIQQNIDQEHYLARLVEAAPELELAMPVSLNIVNFRYIRPDLDDASLDNLNKQIETELQEQGLAVLSTVSIRDRKYLHAGIANHRSRWGDFDFLVREVIRIGNELD